MKGSKDVSPTPQCPQPARFPLLLEDEDPAGDAHAGTMGEEHRLCCFVPSQEGIWLFLYAFFMFQTCYWVKNGNRKQNAFA